MVKIVAVISAFAVVSAEDCDKAKAASRTYAQCGGYTYHGETCCPEDRRCEFMSAEYSQCSGNFTGGAKAYEQCAGGPDYTGPTFCAKHLKCVKSGPYYSGCEPKKALTATKTCKKAQAVSRKYAQCGGYTYHGETCCPKGRGCAFQTAEYSQCKECGKAYAQCAGGPGYNGSTCCSKGFECTSSGAYYSGCQPKKALTFLDTVTADVLLQEPPRDMAAPTDLEVEAQGDACLTQVNKYRATKNLAALRMNSGKNSCAAGQAAKDGPGLTPHAHAGECGESGQCESAGQSSCAASIQGYFGEGPGGGHYKIIMDPSYRSMAYGHKDIGGKYRTWWTQDFFTSSSEDTIVEATVKSNSTVDGKGTCCACASSADCSGSMTCCPHMHKCIKSESTACFTDRDCHPANTVASFTV